MPTPGRRCRRHARLQACQGRRHIASTVQAAVTCTSRNRSCGNRWAALLAQTDPRRQWRPRRPSVKGDVGKHPGSQRKSGCSYVMFTTSVESLADRENVGARLSPHLRVSGSRMYISVLPRRVSPLRSERRAWAPSEIWERRAARASPRSPHCESVSGACPPSSLDDAHELVA